jgi:hypothetical protein
MSIESTDARIGRVERILDLVAIAAGVALMALAPGVRLALSAPALLVAAGLTLLASGLVRDLAWLALHGRRPAAVRTAGPPEARLCLESTLGGVAVAGGLAWRLLAPGPPRPIGIGALVLALALVASFGHLTRNVIVALRVEPGHRNMTFWS